MSYHKSVTAFLKRHGQSFSDFESDSDCEACDLIGGYCGNCGGQNWVDGVWYPEDLVKAIAKETELCGALVQEAMEQGLVPHRDSYVWRVSVDGEVKVQIDDTTEVVVGRV